MEVLELAGYTFEIEEGRIISASFCVHKVSVGDEVKVSSKESKRLGIDQGRIGKVVEISKPDTRNLTSNIIGVDFIDCGLPTAQLKIHEVATSMALRD